MQKQIEKSDQELFDKIARGYARKDSVRSTSIARRFQLTSAIRPVLEELGKVDTIVEIACGVGASAEYLRGSYGRYIGVDYSEKMIEAARVFNGDNPDANFIAGNIKSVQIQKHIADIILGVGALHHMTELDKVMRSIAAMAKPGAYFVGIEPQRGNPVVQIMRWARTKIDRSYSADQHFFSGNELYELMADNGMTSVEIDYQGYLSPPFAQVIMPPQLLTAPLCRLTVVMDSWLARHMPRAFKFLSWNLVIRCRFPH